MLSIVGYYIPFDTIQLQEKISKNVGNSSAQEGLMDMEVREQYLCYKITRTGERFSEQSTSSRKIEFETIEQKSLPRKFQNGRFALSLSLALEQIDYMCKLGLKDTYSRNMIPFQQSGNLYEFLYLRFGLDPIKRIFTNFTRLSVLQGTSCYWERYGTKYSRMDQVKFVEDSPSSINFTWYILEYFVPYIKKSSCQRSE